MHHLFSIRFGSGVSARLEDPVPIVPSSNVHLAKAGFRFPPPTTSRTLTRNAVIWAYAIEILDSANAPPASTEPRVNISHVIKIALAMANVCRWQHSLKVAK